MAQKFTKRQLEIAVEVMIESRYVRNWVKSEAKTYGVDLRTPEGQKFKLIKSREMAELLIK